MRFQPPGIAEVPQVRTRSNAELNLNVRSEGSGVARTERRVQVRRSEGKALNSKRNEANLALQVKRKEQAETKW
jgi:hypothetical protein